MLTEISLAILDVLDIILDIRLCVNGNPAHIIHHISYTSDQNALYQTFDARVGDFQVRLEVIMTRLVVLKVVIQYPDATGPPSGAVTIHDAKDVNKAPDVAEVFLHAPADAHAPVLRMRHQDDLVLVAFDPEVIRLAVGVVIGKR